MKFKAIMASAVAMLSLAACSSDEPANKGGQEEVGGEGYITLSINLPTQEGSRAVDQGNEQFEDGLASEYAVHNAYLMIFQGTSEENAVLKNKYTLGNLRPWNLEGTTDDNVTTKANTVQKINEAPQENLWALVILNYQGDEATFNVEFKATETTFKSLYDTKTVSGMHSAENGIFMCNAPLYDGTTRTTLVKINPNQIYTSLADAQQAKNPLEIYVERGVAKVSVTTPKTEQTISMGTKNGDAAAADVNYVADIKAWMLDVTNKSSYLVRNTSAIDTWKRYDTESTTRFSGASNRIYWAIDPNYSSFDADDFNKYSAANLTANTVKEYEYALENTFDVANQRQNRTTRAIIKATFAPQNGTPTTFYTIGQKGLIYNKAGMQALIKAQAIALFPDKNDPAKYTFAENTSVSSSAGSHPIKENDVMYDGTAISGEDLTKLNDAIGEINTYLNGICYYVARVQHFGQKYTPWSVGDLLYGDEPSASQKYLGRYGMVRNNWYELQISEIKKLGHPTVPAPTSDPDDENEYYMTFNVNVHSWAKRVQDVKL